MVVLKGKDKGAAGVQGVQKMNGVEWVVVWDTCSLMRDQWVGYQVPRTASQPFLCW